MNLSWILWTACIVVLALETAVILYLYLRREPVPFPVNLKIGGMTAEELEKSLGEEKINVSVYARRMLRNKEEFVEPVNKRERERRGKTETLDLVRLRVRDLGFTNPPTTKELFARAKKLGLELCPPETGPYLRLADKDQPLRTRYYIGMEPLTDSDGDPIVFLLERSQGGLWLLNYWTGPDDHLDSDDRIVFRLRPSTPPKTGKCDPSQQNLAD